MIRTKPEKANPCWACTGCAQGVHRVCTGRAQGVHRGAQGVHRVMCHREVKFFSSGDRSNRNFIRVCNTFTTADQPRGLVSPGTGRAVVIHWPTVHLL